MACSLPHIVLPHRSHVRHRRTEGRLEEGHKPGWVGVSDPAQREHDVIVGGDAGLELAYERVHHSVDKLLRQLHQDRRARLLFGG